MAGGRTARRAWVVVAAAAASWGVLSLVSAVVLLLSSRWFEAVLAIGFGRAGYWFAVGAWLRTPWGHLEVGDPLPGPPPLTDERLRLYVLGAGVAVVAVALALALQAIDGQWVE